MKNDKCSVTDCIYGYTTILEIELGISEHKKAAVILKLCNSHTLLEKDEFQHLLEQSKLKVIMA